MKTPWTTPLRRAALAVVLLAQTLPAAPSLRAEPPPAATARTDAQTLIFNGNRQTKTVEANGLDIVVNGNRNELTLRGECRTLTVSGNRNNVSVETVAAIVTPGNQNRVAWSKAAGGGGGKPSITDVGTDNTVTRRSE